MNLVVIDANAFVTRFFVCKGFVFDGFLRLGLERNSQEGGVSI